MIWILFATTPFLVVGAFALGMHLEGRATVRHWVENGYCPTCDRLTTERETVPTRRCSCGNLFDGDNFCMPSACQWEE